MNKRHMRGIIDPISVAFILSIVGSATALHIESTDSKEQVSQKAPVEQVTSMPEAAKLAAE